MNLDLTVNNFIDPAKIEEELINNRDEIRAELFRQIAEQMIPQIVAETQISATSPEGVTKTKAEIKNDYSLLPQVEDSIFSVRTKMDLALSLHSDREVNPIASLYNSRGVLASNIADTFLHGLEEEYLGKKSFETKNEWSFNGDEVTDEHSEQIN